jgi:hypothetical protein
VRAEARAEKLTISVFEYWLRPGRNHIGRLA